MLKFLRFCADVHLAIGAIFNLAAEQLEAAPFAGEYSGTKGKAA